MKCYNCGAIVPDNSEKCSECNILFNQLKVGDRNQKNLRAVLILSNGVSFNLFDPKLKEISIGRKDFGSNPVIDLGPYDSGPYISRLHGVFQWENDSLFYTDKSKNGTTLNDEKLKNNERKILKNGDKIKFTNITGEIKFN